MKKILIFVTILALLSGILLPLLAGSAGATEIPSIPQPDFLPGPSAGSTGSDFQDYALNSAIPKAINIGIGLLGIAAFLAILIAAIQMLTAYGKEDQINRAKTNLRYSMLGFLVVILSYAIVSIISSIALPSSSSSESDSESSGDTSWIIPNAYAVDVENDINILLPSEKTVIEQDEQNRVSLPNGDFLSEILPAAVTNLMYLVAFLIFIAFMYGGSLLVIGRGNEEEAGKAKNIILYSTIALAVISLGYAIIYGISTLKLENDTTSDSDSVFTDTVNP